jgi:hypothetical protein
LGGSRRSLPSTPTTGAEEGEDLRWPASDLGQRSICPSKAWLEMATLPAPAPYLKEKPNLHRRHLSSTARRRHRRPEGFRSGWRSLERSPDCSRREKVNGEIRGSICIIDV